MFPIFRVDEEQREFFDLDENKHSWDSNVFRLRTNDNFLFQKLYLRKNYICVSTVNQWQHFS